MHLLSIKNLGKKCISEVVWETNFGKIHLKKTTFCLRPKEKNTSHCEKSALNHAFKMLIRKVLWYNDIMITDYGKVTVAESDLVETFNDHYINIVEKSSGQKPCNFVSETNSLEDDEIINEIVQHYSNHL